MSLSGHPIYYVRCDRCGFCFAPEMAAWPIEMFERLIYNKSYVEVDPDCVFDRPQSNSKKLLQMFGAAASQINHLDYGGGQGALSAHLSGLGWRSTSYDPFVNKDIDIASLGGFNLITAYEVFEHVPDPKKLIDELTRLLMPNGLILFSTLLSDGEIEKNRRLDWWYASPRNGHISLFSRTSLQRLADHKALNLRSFDAGSHALFYKLPLWAAHLKKLTRNPAVHPGWKFWLS